MSGCAAWNAVVPGEQQKAVLLSQSLKNFQSALHWGAVEDAAAFVAADAMPKFYEEAYKQKRREKLVNIATDSVTFDQEHGEADVLVRIKYIRIPAYVVETRVEKQQWTYQSMRRTWLYSKATVLDTTKEAETLFE